MDTPIEPRKFHGLDFRDYLYLIGITLVTIILFGIFFSVTYEKETEQCPINFTSVWMENKSGYLQNTIYYKNDSYHKVWYGDYNGWLLMRPNKILELCTEINESTLCIPETVYAEINLPCTPCVKITPEGNVKILNESQCPEVEL